jgi:DNA-binding CsgD family transcriptional regulator
MLTPREQEVLEMIGQGKTSKQIAGALNLSVFTVNNHRKHICKKMGLHSTAQLVAFAVMQSQSVKVPG